METLKLPTILALAGVVALQLPTLHADQAPALAEQRQLAEERGDWQAAAEITRRELEKKPDDLGLLTHLARYQTKAGDLTRAAGTLQRVSQLAGIASADILEIRGDLANSENRPADALSDYQLALRAAPESERLLEKLAAHYQGIGDPDSAAIYYERLTPLRDRSRDHLHLARTAVGRRDWNAMIGHLSAASSMAKGSSITGNYERLLAKAIQLGRYDLEIKADPKDIATVLNRATLFRKCGFFEEALADAQRAARIDRRAPHVRIALAHFHAAAGDKKKGAEFNVDMRQLHRGDAGERIFYNLAKHDADVRSHPDDLTFVQARADYLLRHNQASLAMEDIARLLEATPDSVIAQLLQVNALHSTGRGTEARQLVRQLAGQHPENSSVRQQIGEIQMRDGLYEKAITTFDKILVQSPTYEKARDSRTLCYKRLQRQPPAEEPKG